MDEYAGYRLSRRRVGQALVGGTLAIGLNTLTRAFGVATDAFNGSLVASLPKVEGQFLTDSATLNAFAQDYGQVVHEQPLAVLRPGSVRDIQRIVRFARRHRVRVAVLAGQGQCGVITRAVLRARGVQSQVREYVLPYPDLKSLLQAGARLTHERRFDGVIAIITPSPQGWMYLMTAVRQFTPPAMPNDADLLKDLGYTAGKERIRTFDFLEYADAMPNIDYAQSHADLGVFIPQSAAHTFIGDMLPRLTAQDLGGASAMRLFFLRADALHQPLLRVPKESSFMYIVLIRSETNDADALARMLSGNRELYEQRRECGGTLYLSAPSQ